MNRCKSCRPLQLYLSLFTIVFVIILLSICHWNTDWPGLWMISVFGHVLKHALIMVIIMRRKRIFIVMITIIMIMMTTIKMKMIRRKWWASDSDKCEGRSVACPPLSRVYCTLPCIFHFTLLYFCACTFLYFLYFTFLFILQMFFPTFVNCTRLMYLHCTFISMSLSFWQS